VADLGSEAGDAGILSDAAEVTGRIGIWPLLSSGGWIRGGGFRSLADLLLLPAMEAGLGAALLGCFLILVRRCSCFSLFCWPALAARGRGWKKVTLRVFGGWPD
jgi:hypothetical protein